MKHEARLTISRQQRTDGHAAIIISIEDVDSHMRFVEIEIGLAEFAQCITGLGGMECEAEYRGLDKVGKIRESEYLEFEMPKTDYKLKKRTAKDIADKIAPAGWVCSGSFDSQASFFTKDGKDYARTTISRWVE